jgi:6-phosphogluconolactonase
VSGRLELEVLADAPAVAREGARWVAEAILAAVRERGSCAVAFSGGTTPWRMLEHLAESPLPWQAVWLFQVDERVAPAGDPARNWTHLREHLLDRLEPGRLPAERALAMPVEGAAAEPEGPAREAALAAAAASYATDLARACGSPPVLDLVHLGLGDDGHTASLVPGDGALEESRAPVAFTRGLHQGHRRLTITLPALRVARRVLWVVTGEGKRRALAALLAEDPAIPAGRVARGRAGAADAILADRAAAGED